MEKDAAANRLALAQRDMGDVQRYLSVLRKLEKIDFDENKSNYSTHIEAIFMAAVVAYSRPFMRSNSRGQADRRIDPEKYAFFVQNPN